MSISEAILLKHCDEKTIKQALDQNKPIREVIAERTRIAVSDAAWDVAAIINGEGNTEAIVDVLEVFADKILDAVKAISNSVKAGIIDPHDIDEELFSDFLYTADLPDPDL